MFANTTSMGSDFSKLKWEKDKYYLLMMDLSLEGIIQSKQHKLLKSLIYSHNTPGLWCKFVAYLGFIIPDM